MGGEDLAAYFAVIAAGRRLAYVPDAIVWHRHRADLDSLRDQLFGYGVGLSAYLASCIVRQPSRVIDLARRAPAGLRYLLSASSSKNVAKSVEYPATLTLLELLGVLYGPFAYARGRLRARRLRHPRPASS
jgi:hypothetical protein